MTEPFNTKRPTRDDIGQPDDGAARRHWLNAWVPKPERLAADISRDLRAASNVVHYRHLLIEAADKLDGLVQALAKAESERDEARTEHTWVNATRRADALAEANETLAAQVERLLRDRDEAEQRGIRAGREAAAQAIRDRADTIDVEPARVGPRATLRRHLRAAANIAAGPPTPAEVVAGLDNAIVCRTSDIEPASNDPEAT